MNTPQTRFVTLSAMKVTNTEHTALNGNHSKCQMTPIKRKGLILVFVYIFINSSADTSFSTEPVSVVAGNSTHRETIKGAWQKPCTLISFF